MTVTLQARQIPVEDQLGLDQEGVHVVVRQLVLDMGRDRQHARATAGRAARSSVSTAASIALRDRSRRIALDDALRAEILEQQQPLVEIGVIDLGRGEAALAQSLRHRHERRDVLGEMGDRAIGRAVAHRRTVGPARRVHQDHVLVAHREPVVAARRGVALHARAQRLAIAALGDELAHRRDPLHARRERAVAGHARMAELGLELGRERERDVEPVRRQEAVGAVGPFQQHDRALGQVVEAELGELRRAREPVEVGVDHGKSRQVVDLHQGEGRAWHFERPVACKMADHGARERGLAGAEIARERDQVARLERAGDVDHQPARGLLVRQHHRKARTAGRGREHRHGADLRRRPLARFAEREDAGDGGAAADGGIERHRSAVQLDEGAHQRQAEARAAMARAERMGLEPVEHLVLHVGRDAGSVVGHREHDGVLEPLGGQRNGLAGGRKAYGIGQQVEQRLAHARARRR